VLRLDVHIPKTKFACVIIAGSNACPMVQTAVMESAHGGHATVLFFAWLFSQTGEALYSV
jgi:hypothetical protein